MFREAIYRNYRLANASAIMHDFLVSSLHMSQLNRMASLGQLQCCYANPGEDWRSPAMMYKRNLEHQDCQAFILSTHDATPRVRRDAITRIRGSNVPTANKARALQETQ